MIPLVGQSGAWHRSLGTDPYLDSCSALRHLFPFLAQTVNPLYAWTQIFLPPPSKPTNLPFSYPMFPNACTFTEWNRATWLSQAIASISRPFILVILSRFLLPYKMTQPQILDISMWMSGVFFFLPTQLPFGLYGMYRNEHNHLE